MTPVRAALVALLAAGPFCAALPSAALACAEREAAIAAVEASDFATATALYETEVEISADCDDAFRDWLAEAIARDLFRAALEEAPDPAARQALLERSLGYQEHWRTHVELADLAAAAGDRATEAMALQRAINRLNEGPAHHSATEAEIAALFERATVAVRLADTVVVPPRTRNGDAGGIFATSIRGFQVSEVPLAITYEFNSTDFTAQGQLYAAQLLDHLKAVQPPRILLVGHTDPQGGDAYNMALSERRAEALRAYLEAAGYSGEIQIEGRGESDVPPPPPGIAPDSEAHYQIARRVVLKRG